MQGKPKLRHTVFGIVAVVGSSAAALIFHDVSGWLSAAYAQQAPLSIDAAAAMVRRISGGRVIAAEAMDDDGKAVYRIKVLLPEGRVRVYVVDPNSGQVLDS